ncbi:Serine/threonine protein kinase [Thermomonospora echinospora]|uniref:non-specific serine/threonine protein kinase n=1 Tax=Thermomonospora echinospora TaxID=1992 RepID=A0A1H6CB16_9ACTN|nr:serine/threonine-protein kinase [Thermomonospora echinospora]SEG70170.1 Serine/threonine protein kinase [Thermomonospora echinospora]
MEPGEVLDGKYRLVRRLGQGGMGEVWAADDLTLNRRVAVKIVLSNLGTNQELLQRLRREAQAAASLQHPGITVVHAMGEHEGHPFFVMELLEGRDFLALLEANPHGLPVAHAVSLAAQVADALAYAHRKGVVHRDIKPANLMELTEGRAKICDFGVARFADAAPGLTPLGIMIGTPPYTAPEQYRGGTADGRSDLYSFGCTLYALLTGRPPFTGPSMSAFMHQHLHEAPPRPTALRPDIPADLERLVLRLLAKDPAERPAMADVLAKLNELNAAPAAAAPAATQPFAPARTAAQPPLPPVGPPPADPHQAHQAFQPPGPPADPPQAHQAHQAPPAPPQPVQAINGAVARLRGRPARAVSRLWRALASGAGWMFRAPGRIGPDPAHRRDGVGLVLLVAAVVSGTLVWSRTELAVTTAGATALRGTFGLGAFVLPVLVFLLAGRVFRRPERGAQTRRILLGSILLSIGLLGVVHVAAGAPNLFESPEKVSDSGGVIGWLVAVPLEAALTAWGAIPLLLLLSGYGLLVATATPLNRVPERLARLVTFLTSGGGDRTPEERQAPPGP